MPITKIAADTERAHKDIRIGVIEKSVGSLRRTMAREIGLLRQDVGLLRQEGYSCRSPGTSAATTP